uniref:Uncharacterized protein n=1 Tax=Anopheles culicifacies TaxID=139723 RepID=A0A182MQR9_9DIPT
MKVTTVRVRFLLRRNSWASTCSNWLVKSGGFGGRIVRYTRRFNASATANDGCYSNDTGDNDATDADSVRPKQWNRYTHEKQLPVTSHQRRRHRHNSAQGLQAGRNNPVQSWDHQTAVYGY